MTEGEALRLLAVDLVVDGQPVLISGRPVKAATLAVDRPSMLRVRFPQTGATVTIFRGVSDGEIDAMNRIMGGGI